MTMAIDFKKFNISIHSLRMEGDISGRTEKSRRKYFNPLPPHGGRRLRNRRRYWHPWISIHSLRMEGDLWASKEYDDRNNISIHSLRMEGD